MKSNDLIDNSNDLNWFDDICKWADKYDLNHEDFPRDKTLLENMIQLDICDKNINEIPPQIEHLSKLNPLNKITFTTLFQDSVFS